MSCLRSLSIGYGREGGGEPLVGLVSAKIKSDDHRLSVIAHPAILDVCRELARQVADSLRVERRRRGTRIGTRALTCFRQAVLGLRWFRDHTAAERLGRDHRISRATSYRYLDEVIEVLAEQALQLHHALRQAHEQGMTHVILDGTVLTTDRLSEKATSVQGKTIDRWYSG